MRPRVKGAVIEALDFGVLNRVFVNNGEFPRLKDEQIRSETELQRPCSLPSSNMRLAPNTSFKLGQTLCDVGSESFLASVALNIFRGVQPTRTLAKIDTLRPLRIPAAARLTVAPRIHNSAEPVSYPVAGHSVAVNGWIPSGQRRIADGSVHVMGCHV